MEHSVPMKHLDEKQLEDKLEVLIMGNLDDGESMRTDWIKNRKTHENYPSVMKGMVAGYNMAITEANEIFLQEANEMMDKIEELGHKKRRKK